MDVFYKKRSLNIRGILYDLSQPLVMGILNYTPDSFFDGGRYSKPAAVLERVAEMINEGVDIIDVGAVSTRPGAVQISQEEEIRRLTAVMEIIRSEYPEVIISLDTYRSGVLKIIAGRFGVDIANDVSSGSMDEEMIAVVAGLHIPYIAMHMQGTPQTMQHDPRYDDVLNDILKFFSEKVAFLKEMGIKDIIIDPGFGFGKDLDHNYELARRLEAFNMLEMPLLTGFSRKSMVFRLLKVNPENALTGTIALNTIAVMKGADILRVHDVKEAKEVIKIAIRFRQAVSEF